MLLTSISCYSGYARTDLVSSLYLRSTTESLWRPLGDTSLEVVGYFAGIDTLSKTTTWLSETAQYRPTPIKAVRWETPRKIRVQSQWAKLAGGTAGLVLGAAIGALPGFLLGGTKPDATSFAGAATATGGMFGMACGGILGGFLLGTRYVDWPSAGLPDGGSLILRNLEEQNRKRGFADITSERVPIPLAGRTASEQYSLSTALLSVVQSRDTSPLSWTRIQTQWRRVVNDTAKSGAYPREWLSPEKYNNALLLADWQLLWTRPRFAFQPGYTLEIAVHGQDIVRGWNMKPMYMSVVSATLYDDSAYAVWRRIRYFKIANEYNSIQTAIALAADSSVSDISEHLSRLNVRVERPDTLAKE
jgi:hypothetical protein